MEAISHPGMSRVWFDAAVQRAMMAELTIQATSRPGTVAVGSSTDDELVYLVSHTTCSCKAGQTIGRCFHRALFLAWEQSWRHVELGAALYRDETA